MHCPSTAPEPDPQAPPDNEAPRWARQRMESGLDEDNLEVFALPLRPNGPKGMTGVEAAGGTKLSRLWFCPQDTAGRLPLQEGSSAWPGDGEVSAGDKGDGQSCFRNSERRLGLGVEEAGIVTGGSGSGVGDPRLVSTTQGGSMTAAVVRTGGTTGGGRGLVTGAIVDCGSLGSGGKAPRSERGSGVAGGGGSGADSSSRSAEMEDGGDQREQGAVTARVSKGPGPRETSHNGAASTAIGSI
ncbi:unnamed protein product [Gadus morhua 'NCC']